MAETTHKTRPTQATKTEGNEVKANPEVTKKGQELKDELDALLDEIDEVLEVNAAEFVTRIYSKRWRVIQKGWYIDYVQKRTVSR